MSAPRPLAGIRIVDFTHVIAGPIATFQLGMMGADVVKVEPPAGGDQLRRMGGDPARSRVGMGTGFVSINAGKRSIALDLKSAEGQAVAKRLVAGADVVVENYRPGVMARFGLDWESVHAMNPRAVYCSVSGYGQDGPWRDRPAYDHIVQGVAGVMMTQGAEEDPPIKIGFPMADTAAGYSAAFAIVTALLERATTGIGRRLDVAMTTATLAMLATPVNALLVSGELPQRIGNLAFSGSPASGTYATADGQLVLTANTGAQFAKLCTALARPDLARDFDPATWKDPAFDFSAVRGAIADALLARTALEWEALLNPLGVPCGKVRDVAEAIDEPQVQARGFVQRIPDPADPAGTIGVHGPGFRYADAAFAPHGPVPRLGEHGAAILAEAGYDRSAIEALARAGVIAFP
jgi:crotonobetainyl-CoA:carnitine CoA-transferase CaiB-like acyl-CoA transferase